MRPWALLLLLLSLPARASEPRTLGVGFTYLGGQVRYAFTPHWTGELRYLTGTVGGDGGYTTTQVLGVRGYRMFETGAAYRFFLGGELAAFNASDNQQGVFHRAQGAASGGFGGIEYFFYKKAAFSLDAGPYIFKVGGDTSFDFVVNASVNWYFY
jgi:hypothetical protein